MAVTFRAAAAGTQGSGACTINAPAGVTAGDFLIAGVLDGASSGGAFTWPAGWTVVSTSNGDSSSRRFEVATMVYASDSSWAVTTTSFPRGVCGAYTGISSLFLNGGTTGVTGSQTTLSTPTVAIPGSQAWYVAVAAYSYFDATATYTPASATQRLATGSGNDNHLFLVDSAGAALTGSQQVVATLSGAVANGGYAWIGSLGVAVSTPPKVLTRPALWRPSLY